MSDLFEALPTGTRTFRNTNFQKRELPGVLAELRREHRDLFASCQRLIRAKDLATRNKLWSRLQLDLGAHERAERQVVYKEFASHSSLRALIDDHANQSRRLETLVSELNALPLDALDWLLVFRRLEATLTRHVEEEEIEFFPRAYDALGKDNVTALLRPYRTAKRTFAAR